MATKAERYRQIFLALHGRSERKLFRALRKSIKKDVLNLPLEIINDRNYESIVKGLQLKETEKVLQEFYIETGTFAGEMAKRNIEKQMKRISPFFSDVWKDYILRKATFMIASKIVTIQSTLIEDINKLIKEYISLNLDITDIANAIKDFVNEPDFYRWQAMRIARTETTVAMNTAVNLAGEESGVLLDKEWISAEDAKVRPSHAEMNGMQVDMNQKFANGLRYPGDPLGSASEVINCRCTFLQVPKRDNEENLIFGR
jgi:uncharacterized protein with gpF-like domain